MIKIEFDKSEIINICREYKEGLAISIIAKNYNVSDRTIQRLLNKEKVWIKNKYPRKNNRRKHKFDDLFFLK